MCRMEIERFTIDTSGGVNFFHPAIAELGPIVGARDLAFHAGMA
ncbi:hypothetical protein [Syntrophobacter fumaroxidans]|nr:hypothetical protein [Syntrophobacter fumaroxidans]